MVVGIGALLFVTTIVVWMGFLGGGGGGVTQISFPPARTIEVDLEILEDPLFLEIQESSSEIIIPENIGRDNPFEL